MTDKKGWGSTVMGWFIVKDGASSASAEGDPSYRPFSDVAADTPAAGKNPAAGAAAAPQPELNVFTTKPPDAPGGKVDFDQVFEAAGIDAAERERITRTLQLLDSLPAETPEPTKKQIVQASLNAFGVPIDKIIETGAEQLQTLEAYIRTGASDTEKVSAEADTRIKQFEEEIVRLRTVVQQRIDEQNAVIASCNAKKLEVQKVLEFFGQAAVARVVRDSPKLHEPPAS